MGSSIDRQEMQKGVVHTVQKWLRGQSVVQMGHESRLEELEGWGGGERGGREGVR